MSGLPGSASAWMRSTQSAAKPFSTSSDARRPPRAALGPGDAITGRTPSRAPARGGAAAVAGRERAIVFDPTPRPERYPSPGWLSTPGSASSRLPRSTGSVAGNGSALEAPRPPRRRGGPRPRRPRDPPLRRVLAAGRGHGAGDALRGRERTGDGRRAGAPGSCARRLHGRAARQLADGPREPTAPDAARRARRRRRAARHADRAALRLREHDHRRGGHRTLAGAAPPRRRRPGRERARPRDRAGERAPYPGAPHPRDRVDRRRPSGSGPRGAPRPLGAKRLAALPLSRALLRPPVPRVRKAEPARLLRRAAQRGGGLRRVLGPGARARDRGP